MSGNETQTYSVLSERELQIVELVASGLTNQDIANSLEISKRTVDNHISNILQKTGTGNRVALFRWALNWGKICIDEVNCCKLPESPVQNGGETNGHGIDPKVHQEANGHAASGDNGYSKAS